MSSFFKSEQRLSMAPPRRGLSMGWLLTIFTALIVTLVMGGMALIQHIAVLKNQHDDREDLLRESLSPLASQLESSETLEELRHHLEQFHHSYTNRNYPDHQVVLLDDTGGVVYSTLPGGGLGIKPTVFRASMPVALPALAHRQATLVVLRDIKDYEQTVKRQWIFWAVHIAVTLGSIFLFLYPAIHYLVIKPIKGLVKGVQKMEMGYWKQLSITSGAWEIQWLGWRFGNMIAEVRRTVAQLVEAERKAQMLIGTSRDFELHESEKQPITLQRHAPECSASLSYKLLIEQIRRLQSASLEDNEAVALARKVWKEDAVTANRLGFPQLKNQLEDAALRLLEPTEFGRLDRKLAQIKGSHRKWSARCGENLCRALEEKMVPCVGVFYRVKHTAGVWSKMRKKGLDLTDIQDLYAFRIVVPTESDCYSALGAIHQAFKPVGGRFKDYIVSPKANGYQSLHTSVVSNDGLVFEVQIRSVAMHNHSESGTAAHWIYKKEVVETCKVHKAVW